MNIALIFAGGTGKRMNSKTKPKQFLQLHGKEIIVYTLEHFQYHDEIDAIVVVCVKEWIAYLQNLINKYQLTKVRWITEGGKTGQESIFNGLSLLHKECPKKSIVLVHDGVRPLIDEKVITDNINSVKKYGSAISSSSAVETVITTLDENKVNEIADRSVCKFAKAPQSFWLDELYTAHLKAINDGNYNMIDSASLMNYYGYALYTVECGSENIKITTPADYYIFRAIYEAKENSQIFGL